MSYRTENNITLKYKGEYKMQNLTDFTNDSKYCPMPNNQLRDIDFSSLTVGTEYPLYDSITDNHFTLDGKRISLKKEYETRIVIGCVECPEYSVIEDEELENISCELFVDNFLSLLNSIYLPINPIAA